jgi:hypothetical protein
LTTPDLKDEITRFRLWESKLPAARRVGLWEIDYPGWGALSAALAAFIQATEPARWDQATVADLLYIIARDHEAEYLVAFLENHPAGLLSLVQTAADRGEPDAKWQLADALGRMAACKTRAAELLLVLVDDDHEYVSRRALLALAYLGSPHVPRLCARAWATGHEYQRIAALHAIHAASPQELPKYVELAMADGRPNVVQNARALQPQDSINK